MDGGWTKADRETAKRVGGKVNQGEECGSALLACIVFDKDNPEGWWNTVHSVVIMRVRGAKRPCPGAVYLLY